ncbi:MAG: thioredoxin domain-containing protein [Patescibacteria group bacterium]|nr:thioredoxin domain-containing protein [Patescibacteria group bacterium]MDE2590007.1 thioredoxin domain-containing protein [Patescibacteria group bacterium]
MNRLLFPPANAKDHHRGDLTAPMALVEYGDFECEDSLAAYLIVKQLQAKFGDKLVFVFRHFPLTDLKHIHPHAKQASVACEIAAEYGKFWGMHDLLFENQIHLEENDLAEMAVSLGIDKKEFLSKQKDPKYMKKVEKSYENGLENGVHGTPTFFMNNVLYEGLITIDACPRSLESLKG